jgi:exopolysaccharide biosynthesis polyprenyl glycosylphosphotransferase
MSDPQPQPRNEGTIETRLTAVPVHPEQRQNLGRQLRGMLMLTGCLDLVALTVSVLVAWSQRDVFPMWDGVTHASDLVVAASGLSIIPLWVLMLAAQGAYNLRNFGSGAEEFRLVGLASVISAGLFGLTCYLFMVPLPRGFVVLSFLVGTPALLVARYAVRHFVHQARRNGRLQHRVIAVGGPSGIGEVVDALRRNRQVGYEVIGAVLPSGITADADRFPVPVLGGIGDTKRLCAANGADTVLVARGGFASAQELRKIAWDLEGSDIDLVVVPSLTDVAGPRIHMRPVAGLPLLHVEEPQAGKAGGLTKRLFDIAAAAVALLLLSPLLLGVAVAIKLHDGGPLLFRQQRIGRNGQPFPMIKFRSMVLEAEEMLEDLLVANESDGVLFKIKEDPRITRVGRFLRRYSIDELPQLVNVLRGEMSLVGPRPPLPSEVDRYALEVHRRLLVRPGLTGLWQVSGRSRLTWDESVRLDLYYVDNWSMTSDLVIMAKTVRAVLTKHGAY